MEAYLTRVVGYVFTQSWQIAVLTLAVAVATFALRNRSAHSRYLLWLIVLAKCLVPPLYSVPLGILPRETPADTTESAEAGEAPADSVPLPDRVGLAYLPGEDVPSTPSPDVTSAQARAMWWLVIAWIAGVGVYLLMNALRALRANFWLRKKRRTLPARLQTDIKELFAAYYLKHFPRIWLIEGMSQPFVWGVLRGSIYLPADFANVSNPAHRRSVLGHELSHVLRFDAAVNLLQVIAQAIFWFHPLVWWANRNIRAEREKCCDEMAIARLNTLPRDYSTAVVETLAARSKSTRPVPSLAVAGPVKNIEERIKTMLRPGKKFYKHPSLPVVAVVVLTALLAVPTTVILTARAEDPASSESANADFMFGTATNLGPTVNIADASGPNVSVDGLTLFFHSRRPGGSGSQDIWVTTRATKEDPWRKPFNLGPTVNSSDWDASPSISADALELYFHSNRSGGKGSGDIWVTTRDTIDNEWGNPINLGSTVNSSSEDITPSISVDGLSLFFSSTRPGGHGSFDIWVTTRTNISDPWRTPVNLGSTVNSSYEERQPAISANGLSLFFHSGRPGGWGSADIWVTTRKTKGDPWTKPVNLGPTINTSFFDGHPSISGDGLTLFFMSNRAGGHGGWNIWQVSLKARAAKDGSSAEEEKKQPTKSLQDAAAEGDIEQVKSLISKGTDVNAKDRMGRTALHRAAEKGHTDVVKFLIDRGADVKAMDRRGQTALHLAAQEGHTDVVRLFIDRGAEVNAKDRNQTTPLHRAAMKGNKRTIELLLSKGADINAKDRRGGTPLFAAMTSTEAGRKEVVELLIAKGAKVSAFHLAAYMGDMEKLKKCLQEGVNVDTPGDCNSTALHLAANSGKKNIVEFLIGKGAQVDPKDESGWTPLLFAASHNYEDIADLLLSKGANVEAKDERGYTLLHYAIWHQDKNAVKLLISKGANVNVKDESGYTPVVWAIWMSGKDIVELLISKGADVNAEDKEGYTPMHWATMMGSKDLIELLTAKGAAAVSTIHLAAAIGDLEKVKAFIEKGTDVNAKDKADSTALQYAIWQNHKDVAAFLIDKGADINLRDKRGQTLLHQACLRGHNEVAELLISKGADVKDKGRNGTTPLHNAASVGHRDIVELLIAKGADVNAEDKAGVTPLGLAEENGYREIAELLRKHGANASVGMNNTPLHEAAALGYIEQVKSLISEGADVNARNSDGRTPLDVAAMVGNREVVELLISRGADVNIKNRWSNTPLHVAAKSGHRDVVDLLIAKGADVNVKNRPGATPLHFAGREGHKDVIELLIAKGANVNAQNNRGLTPLDFAEQEGHKEIVELLLKHGAKE